MNILKKILFTIFLLLPLVVNGQTKTFPGALGFGKYSRHAYETTVNPTILYVDTLIAADYNSDATHGSLEWALEEPYPRIIVIERGGIIDYRENAGYIICEPYYAVYGQTAPYPGVSILKVEIRSAKHGLWQHVNFILGDSLQSDGSAYINDCMYTFHGEDSVYFNHCTFGSGSDEMVSTYASQTTYDNCAFLMPLHATWHANESIGTPEKHGLMSIMSGSQNDSSLTMHKNLIIGSNGRNPRLTMLGRSIVSNNYGYNFAGMMGQYSGETAKYFAIIGNVLETPSTSSTANQWCFEYASSLTPLAEIFRTGNISPNGFADSATWDGNPTIVSDLRIDTADFYLWDTDDVKDSVLANAGAFQWNRPDWTLQAIDSISSSTFEYTNNLTPKPAYTHNWDNEGYPDTYGNFTNGFDFSTTPVSFNCNGSLVDLTIDCVDLQAVLDHINNNLPTGVQASKHKHPNSNFLVLETVEYGSGATLTLSDVTDLQYLGTSPGTYYGSDGFGYPEYTTTSTTLNIPDNPNTVSVGGYTNIELWADSLAMGVGADSCASLSTTGIVTDEVGGDSNGAINTTTDGGTSPYGFLWNDSNTDEDRTGLSAGVYYVITTDDVGCTDSTEFTVANLSICDTTNIITTELVNIPDTNNTGVGELDITVNGGQSPYTYLWSNDSTTKAIDSLTADIYSVIVTDANTCTGNESFTVSNVTTGGGDTTLTGTIKINFGPATHEYTGDGTGTDTWNNAIVLTQGAQVALIDTTISSTGVIMTNTTAWDNTYLNGQISIDGYPDSVAVSQFSLFSTSPIDTLTFTNITDSLWTFHIMSQRTSTGDRTTRFIAGTDSVDIQAYGTVAIGEISTTPTNETIKLIVKQINGTHGYLNSLIIEQYDVEVDVNPCDTTTILIDSVSSILDTLINGVSQNTGALTISISGGDNDYTYLWSNSETTQNISDVDSGSYSITVTDGNGCTGNDAFIVGYYDSITSTLDTIAAGEDIKLKNWADKINLGIDEYNVRVPASLETLKYGRPNNNTYQDWCTKTNLFRDGFVSITSDSLDYTADSLGLFRIRANEVIYLEGVTD